MNKNNSTWDILVLFVDFFRFLEELRIPNPKSPFKINWPLIRFKKCASNWTRIHFKKHLLPNIWVFCLVLHVHILQYFKFSCGCFWRQLFLSFFTTVAVWTPKNFFPLLIRPQGSQGCQKITFFYKWKCFPFALRLPPKDTNFKNHQNWRKKCQKTPVFLDFFKYSSIWGQS